VLVSRNPKASSSQKKPAPLEYNTDGDTERNNDAEIPPTIGRRLRRTNAIGLINKAEKRTQPENEASDEDFYVDANPGVDNERVAYEPMAAEPGADWEMVDESPKAKKKYTKPKTRELIKVASEHNAQVEHDSEDKMVSTSTSLRT
jgi:hypothetical protein